MLIGDTSGIGGVGGRVSGALSTVCSGGLLSTGSCTFPISENSAPGSRSILFYFDVLSVGVMLEFRRLDVCIR